MQVTGDLVVTGDCTEADGACAPDFVFESSYELESIEDHAKYMWNNKHLPAVGAGSDQVNVVKSAYGVLEELEKAHIYIDQLHQRLSKLEQWNTELHEDQSQNKALEERLALIERAIQVQPSGN